MVSELSSVKNLEAVIVEQGNWKVKIDHN
jgi:hypothetical protein